MRAAPPTSSLSGQQAWVVGMFVLGLNAVIGWKEGSLTACLFKEQLNTWSISLDFNEKWDKKMEFSLWAAHIGWTLKYYSCHTSVCVCVCATCNRLSVVLSVCDWNSFKRIHGNIHSTAIRQSVVRVSVDSPCALERKEKEKTKERLHNISSLCVCVYWQPLGWLLQSQIWLRMLYW